MHTQVYVCVYVGGGGGVHVCACVYVKKKLVSSVGFELLYFSMEI